MNQIQSILRGLFGEKRVIPASTLPKDLNSLSQKDKELLKQIGCTISSIQDSVNTATAVTYDRLNVYKEIDRARRHPIMSGALDIYSDIATTYSTINGGTIWPVATNKKYENEIRKLFDIIDIEERIFDWTWNLAAYGDLFITDIKAVPGVGIVSIDDSQHPIDFSRIDVNGRLVGFFKTPISHQNQAKYETDVMRPWEAVHFRVLGSKMRRSSYGNTSFSDFTSYSLSSPDACRLSSKYGTSVLINGLSAYKRLSLIEDCLIMSRVSKGPLKYIYKVAVDGSSADAVAEIIDEYKSMLKRARSVDTNPNNRSFDDKLYDMAGNEDVILPVWGGVNNLAVEKLGGEVDIKHIVDIEEARSSLASAICVPLPFLGGYTKEISGGNSRAAIDRYDIRFSRRCRRLQRAVIAGVTRLVQIHLAYLKMDPDPQLFQIKMSETSTAEEEELKDGLKTSVDSVSGLINLLNDTMGENGYDKKKMIDYLNQKIMKLADFPIDAMASEKNIIADSKGSDYKALLPKFMVKDSLNEGATSEDLNENLSESIWRSNFKDDKPIITIDPKAEVSVKK